MSMDRHVAPVLGAPCWVSLTTRDLTAAQDFYGAVMNWSFRTASFGDAFCVALADDQPVAGIAEVAPGWQAPVDWTPYFAVADADDVASRVRERGATVAVGPLRLGYGRAALAADRDGARFGLWEGQSLSWTVGEGNAPALLELRTRDAFDAAIFYAQIFDWATPESECRVDYEEEQVIVRQGDRAVATLRGGGVESAPDPRIRPRWHVHFRVRDLDKTTTAAVAAGGTVTPVVEPTGGASGPRAVIRDPDGALFTVSTGDGP
ncbi:VOC family protein [Streptomyces lydicus]|uniref:VOC family protein n=1 Tax=Streptomyces lydicus TaxID=47763 RepID=UPI00379A178D